MIDHVVALLRKGLLKESQELCEDILRRKPASFEALHLLGVIAGLNKNHQLARELFDRAIRLKPDSSEAYNNLGNAQKELKLLEAAVASYERSISLRADNAQAYRNRGLALHELKRVEAAIASFNKAIEFRSDYAEAYMNRGISLQELEKPHAAIASYDRAISIKPDYAEAHYNRANALKQLKKLKPAIASYDRAIEHRQDYAEAHWNKALTLLTAGSFEKGWQLYEWRWKCSSSATLTRYFQQPLWLGDTPINGKRVLLHSEQGLGDTIQFCRYATLVAEQGAHVIALVPNALTGLLNNLEGVSEVIAEGAELPVFDVQCPIMSLPLAFKTNLSTIPYGKRRYLKSDKAKVAEWGKRLGPSVKTRIGLVWSGGLRPEQPELREVNERRNLPFEKLKPLLGIDAEFFSLQKGEPAEAELKQKLLHGWDGPEIKNYADDLLDFMDTAALIENLDLVISVDTSTAHLAAGLGKDVWILNRYDSCWRWLADRNDSPWYPSVRLFSQKSAGDWDGVMSQVRKALFKRYMH